MPFLRLTSTKIIAFHIILCVHVNDVIGSHLSTGQAKERHSFTLGTKRVRDRDVRGGRGLPRGRMR